MKVLAYGEILWDIINGEEHLGGAPFNFAAHTAKCGNESSIISRVGADFRGVKAYNRCKEYGVNNSFVQWDLEHATGIVEVVLHEGQPSYTIINNVAYDFIEVSASIQALKNIRFNLFYFGSLAQRNERSAATLAYILRHFSFDHVFYDVNLRKDSYSISIIENSLKYCTILKLNADEVPVIAKLLFDRELDKDSFCKAVRALYPTVSYIVITASDKGCYIFHHEALEYMPGKKVEVNDAVGAGDAFSAGFMHVLCHGGDPVTAAHIANQIGAYVTTQRGAIPDYTPAIRKLLNVTRKDQSHTSEIDLNERIS